MTVSMPARLVDPIRDTVSVRLPEALEHVDTQELARRIDLPGAIEDGIDAVGRAVQDGLGQLPGRQRSRRRTPLLLLAAAAGAAILGVTIWRLRRMAADAAARRFDGEAIDRATDEGMAPWSTSNAQSLGDMAAPADDPEDVGRSNGMTVDPDLDRTEPVTATSRPGI